MFHKFFANQSAPTFLNDTLLCLILKFENANHLKNFRPISLCNTAYKIITKIFAKRIKPHLPNFIGPYQTNFLKGAELVIMSSSSKSL